ncbi:hypothetical protein [Stenotrophomonas cyclobalanopsidis]|uniref:hypothetical protein n=1 Tax=Stenotrophomonas cyclobalanopsidis TaxID=2771362 RepID=UPI0034603F4A
MNDNPAGAVPTTLNCAPLPTLSLPATELVSATPAAVDRASSMADEATTRRSVALAQLPGAAASHSW